jgi:nucleoside 2-deoxyribosyltransferase
MFNPEIKLARSKGIDLPLFYIYLAGYMSGNKLQECTSWRKQIREHYKNYEFDPEYDQYVSFPAVFLDPFNGKEFQTISKDGVTSHIPGTAIRKSDRMSVKKAEIIIANMKTFGESRPMIGTHHEMAWAEEDKKPIILICEEKDMTLYKNHPFTCDCDYYFTEIKEVIDNKIIETYYKRIAGAIYE